MTRSTSSFTTVSASASATRRALLSVGVAVAMAGCASRPTTGDSVPAGTGTPAPGPGGGPAAPVPTPRRTLASEQRRLRDALQGTPVVVQTTSEGALQVLVPLEFCFDARRSAVKRPLGAVLDRIAVGQRDAPGFNLRINAPADEGGAAVLASERAASVRDYLVGRGVPRPRVVDTGRRGDAQVEVLITERGG